MVKGGVNMSAGERLWWEETVSRTMGSVTWDKMKQLGDIQLHRPCPFDTDRMWRVDITMTNPSEAMKIFWSEQMCGDCPMELYIYGRNEEGLPSGIWILQKISSSSLLTEDGEEIPSLTIGFVQDERYLAIPRQQEGC